MPVNVSIYMIFHMPARNVHTCLHSSIARAHIGKHRHTHWHTGAQAHSTQAHRHTGAQAHRHTDTQTHRHTGTQAHGHRHTGT